jgi:hypothetical protein
MRAALRLLALAAVAALGVVAAREPKETADGAAEAAPPPPRAFAPLLPSSPDTAPALIARSPFAPDRTAYARPTAEAAPPPEVRLTAIARVGGVLKATLVVDGAESTVGEGDVTPIGRVAAIGDTSIAFEGNGLTLSLFR